MLVSEMNGCEDCPLNNECLGMKCYGGMPIEPPCLSWCPDETIDNVIDYYYDNKIKEDTYYDEKIKKEKEKRKMAKESRHYVHSEVKKIKDLKKVIRRNENIMRMAKHPLEIENEKIYDEIKKIEKIKEDKLKELRKKRRYYKV